MKVHDEPRAHISLKHSLTPAPIGRYVKQVIETDNCTSFSTTESGRRYLRAIRSELGADWIVRLSGEYVIGVRRSQFRPVAFKSTLTRLTKVYADRSAWRDLFVHRRLFVHRETGRHYAIGAGHPPASVEAGNNWRSSNPQGVAASQRGMRRLGRWVVRAEKRWPGVVVAIGLDANVDHHRSIWRNRFGGMLRLESMWDKTQPPRGTGTHAGGRLIDAIYANVPMTSPHISRINPPAGVDHRAVVATLRIKESR